MFPSWRPAGAQRPAGPRGQHACTGMASARRRVLGVRVPRAVFPDPSGPGPAVRSARPPQCRCPPETWKVCEGTRRRGDQEELHEAVGTQGGTQGSGGGAGGRGGRALLHDRPPHSPAKGEMRAPPATAKGARVPEGSAALTPTPPPTPGPSPLPQEVTEAQEERWPRACWERLGRVILNPPPSVQHGWSPQCGTLSEKRPRPHE